MSDRLKVLIVDDEYLIRNLIKMRIDWNALDMEISGEASNAHEALEMVDQLLPDIIFTDICMPFLDGIELSRLVFEKHPHIKIVVITGHDEFEYARKSIKLGIADFLLKPIKPAELRDVANRLRREIEGERGREREYARMRRQLAESMPVLREKFLNTLLTASPPKASLPERLAYFAIPMQDAMDFQIAVAEFTHAVPGHSEEDCLLLEIKCHQKAVDYFRESKGVILFSDNRRRSVLLCGGGEVDLLESCEQLKTALVNRYKCYADFGVSAQHTGFDGLRLCYREACNALEYRTVAGKNQVICYKDVIVSAEEAYHTDFALMEQLRFYIGAGAVRQAGAIVEEILGGVRYRGADTMGQVQAAAVDIFSVCNHMEREQNILPPTSSHSIEGILSAGHLPGVKALVLELVEGISTAISNSKQTQAGAMVRKVREYLAENLHNTDLNLSDVAGAFHVSPGHLGRLMKQETGQTFLEHLTSLRVKRAQTLLRETSLKSYQIGEQVGIHDPHYFSILFKKCIGISPGEYRGGAGKEEELLEI